jgi:hypothetical protein
MVFFSSVSNAEGEEQLSKKKKYLFANRPSPRIHLSSIYLLASFFIYLKSFLHP